MPKKSKKTTTYVTQPQTTKIIQSFEQTRGRYLRPHRQLPGALQSLRGLYAQEVEDLRRVPAPFKKDRYLRNDGTPARYGMLPVQGRMPHVREQLRPKFYQPKQTLVCLRRQTRRRVIFALQKAGKGGGRQKPAKWTAKSYIRCK